MRKVIVAGMYRSGTTWLYNIVRLLLRGEDVWAGFEDQYRPNSHKWNLIKTHKFYASLAYGADWIMMPYRPPSEVLASIYRFNDLNDRMMIDPDCMDRFYEHTLLWANRADYMFHFDKIRAKPQDVVTHIAGLLKVTPNLEVIEEVDNLDPGEDTLLHPHHITNA